MLAKDLIRIFNLGAPTWAPKFRGPKFRSHGPGQRLKFWARSFGGRGFGARSFGARNIGPRSFGSRSVEARTFGAQSSDARCTHLAHYDLQQKSLCPLGSGQSPAQVQLKPQPDPPVQHHSLRDHSAPPSQTIFAPRLQILITPRGEMGSGEFSTRQAGNLPGCEGNCAAPLPHPSRPQPHPPPALPSPTTRPGAPGPSLCGVMLICMASMKNGGMHLRTQCRSTCGNNLQRLSALFFRGLRKGFSTSGYHGLAVSRCLG